MLRADWIGPLGGLVPIEGSSTVDTSRDSPITIVTSVEGVKRGIRAFRPTLRTWQMSEPRMEAASLAVLDAFADGLYGLGPWVFVPGTAVVSSVLTPAQSALRNVSAEFTPAGPVVVDGVHLPVSLSVSIPSGWRGLVDVPVVPGQPVTASVWVQSATGAPIISTGWIIGGSIPATESVTGGAGGAWQRLSWSGVAPAGASQLRLGVRSSVTAVAGPQVTWTPAPVPYASGAAAAQVIVHPPGAKAWGTWGSFRSDASYVVEEVGDAGW